MKWDVSGKCFQIWIRRRKLSQIKTILIRPARGLLPADGTKAGTWLSKGAVGQCASTAVYQLLVATVFHTQGGCPTVLWLAPIDVDRKQSGFYFDCPFGLHLISAPIGFWVFHIHFHAAGGFWVWLSLVTSLTARII